MRELALRGIPLLFLISCFSFPISEFLVLELLLLEAVAICPASIHTNVLRVLLFISTVTVISLDVTDGISTVIEGDTIEVCAVLNSAGDLAIPIVVEFNTMGMSAGKSLTVVGVTIVPPGNTIPPNNTYSLENNVPPDIIY